MREGAVFVLLEAIDGDEGQKQRFACGGLLKKEIHLILEFLHGALVYSEKSFGVFDLLSLIVCGRGIEVHLLDSFLGHDIPIIPPFEQHFHIKYVLLQPAFGVGITGGARSISSTLKC